MSSFRSSRSVARSRFITSSKDIERLMRNASKLASGGSMMKQKGDYFVRLRMSLGERLYKKLCENENLALEEFHYYVVRINEQGDGQEMRQREDVIIHDYLVLKLRPGDPTAKEVHIMAHKLPGGIYIELIPSSDVTSVFPEGVDVFTVACREKRIRLETLVAILKEENYDYDFNSANCWHYAKNTATRLVKACMETPGVNSAEKARLQEEHDQLEAKFAVYQTAPRQQPEEHVDSLEASFAVSLFQSVAQFLRLSKVKTFLISYFTWNWSKITNSAVSLVLSPLPNMAASQASCRKLCLKIALLIVLFFLFLFYAVWKWLVKDCNPAPHCNIHLHIAG